MFEEDLAGRGEGGLWLMCFTQSDLPEMHRLTLCHFLVSGGCC